MSPKRREIELSGGVLSVEVDRCDWSLDELCGFASRDNPKRRFLFVSKVLGKHVPVRPSTMARAYSDLADKIRQTGLDGPMVCLALCETATGLGEGVWEALSREGADALFVHSTRSAFALPLAFRFEEAHSHAVDHLLYRPRGREEQEMFDHSRTLILVDDEISTGKTMREIARAYLAHNPDLRRVVVVTLTDWVAGEVWDALWEGFPCEVVRTSLLRGRYDFQQSANMPFGPGSQVDVIQSQRAVLLPEGPRFGILAPSRVPDAWLEGCLTPDRGQILVLGTGEFHHLPFRFARELEARGWNVRYQSSTRSPILVGHAIETVLAFQDHHGEGIANFLYNVSPGQYERVLIGYEVLGELPQGHTLPSVLGAQTLRLHGR